MRISCKYFASKIFVKPGENLIVEFFLDKKRGVHNSCLSGYFDLLLTQFPLAQGGGGLFIFHALADLPDL
jgi:hypothetical protein